MIFNAKDGIFRSAVMLSAHSFFGLLQVSDTRAFEHWTTACKVICTHGKTFKYTFTILNSSYHKHLCVWRWHPGTLVAWVQKHMCLYSYYSLCWTFKRDPHFKSNFKMSLNFASSVLKVYLGSFWCSFVRKYNIISVLPWQSIVWRNGMICLKMSLIALAKTQFLQFVTLPWKYTEKNHPWLISSDFWLIRHLNKGRPFQREFQFQIFSCSAEEHTI